MCLDSVLYVYLMNYTTRLCKIGLLDYNLYILLYYRYVACVVLTMSIPELVSQ